MCREEVAAIEVPDAAALGDEVVDEFRGDIATFIQVVGNPHEISSATGSVNMTPVRPPPNLPGLMPNTKVRGSVSE